MTSEEGPGPLAVGQMGAGLCEDYGPVQGDDIIEEVGPGDDVSSDLSALVVPFPELAPVVFFCLKQTTCPRNWCIRMVSSPYPSSAVTWGHVTQSIVGKAQSCGNLLRVLVMVNPLRCWVRWRFILQVNANSDASFIFDCCNSCSDPAVDKLTCG